MSEFFCLLYGVEVEEKEDRSKWGNKIYGRIIFKSLLAFFFPFLCRLNNKEIWFFSTIVRSTPRSQLIVRFFQPLKGLSCCATSYRLCFRLIETDIGRWNMKTNDWWQWRFHRKWILHSFGKWGAQQQKNGMSFHKKIIINPTNQI